MGKVNVYLPDELEAAVRASGLSISAICQQAIVDVLATAEALAPSRSSHSHHDIDIDSLLAGATRVTPRLKAILGELADDRTNDAPITAHDLFGAIALHGENVGAQVLRLAGVELPPPAGTGRKSKRTGPRPARRALSADAAGVLSSALRIAIDFRHNYIGAEHVVVALAEPPSPMADMFTALGVDGSQLRRLVDQVVGGLARPGTAAPVSPPVERIDRLEREMVQLRAQLDELSRRTERRSR